MKVLDIPKSGKCGGVVFYRTHRGQYSRRHVIPHDPRTAAQRLGGRGGAVQRKCGGVVFSRAHRGQYSRRHVIPHDPRTAAQRLAREVMTAVSKAWRDLLTEEERGAWRVAGPKVD